MESAHTNDLSRTGTRFTFQDIFQGLTRALNFDEMLDCLLAVALRELQADEGSLLLLAGQDQTQLKMLASRGLPEEVRQRGYVPRVGSISERVLNERRPLIVNGSVNHSSDSSLPLKPRQIRSALCAPLIAQGRILGTMNINRTRPEAPLFTERDLCLAEMIASQAAMVIDHHRLHEQLMEKERLAAVGQVVTGIAHCVKNLLTGVQGGLGLVRMGHESNNSEVLGKGIEILNRSIALLSHVILDLLDISKQREPVRSIFSAREVLEGLKELLEWRAQSRGVMIIVDLPEDFELWADREQISRAFLNLLLNAIDACGEKYHSREGGCVTLRAQRLPAAEAPLAPEESKKAREWALFEISDNGPGIAPEVVPYLWDLFFSTKGSKGTGIGLPAARKVVSEHGGKILLETSPGSGTTFTVVLPCSNPPGEE